MSTAHNNSLSSKTSGRGRLKIACLADSTDKARAAYKNLSSKYVFIDTEKNMEEAQAIIVLGGDGFMLECMHKYMKLNIPFYGLNCGTIGFLMNRYRDDNLFERMENAHVSTLHPLKMFVRTVDGKKITRYAINEVSLLRETRQAAKIRVIVDHVIRIDEMICDGILASTAAGSTAYNFSANGPIIPQGSNLLALTPISVFRPRRWRGALLPASSSIFFEILEPEKRPVSAVADFHEVRDVILVEVCEHKEITIRLLFDPEESLNERMVREQFVF